jgi:hypothetical protein
MTFPGVSIMEWMVDCRIDLVAAKGIGTTNTTHLRIGDPKFEKPPELCKPLLLGLFWFTEGSRVGDVAKILV